MATARSAGVTYSMPSDYTPPPPGGKGIIVALVLLLFFAYVALGIVVWVLVLIVS